MIVCSRSGLVASRMHIRLRDIRVSSKRSHVRMANPAKQQSKTATVFMGLSVMSGIVTIATSVFVLNQQLVTVHSGLQEIVSSLKSEEESLARQYDTLEEALYACDHELNIDIIK